MYLLLLPVSAVSSNAYKALKIRTSRSVNIASTSMRSALTKADKILKDDGLDQFLTRTDKLSKGQRNLMIKLLG